MRALPLVRACAREQGFDIYATRKPWRYDQFHPTVVSVVLDRLLAPLRFGELADPVLLTRKLSAMLNANDDGGLLVGKWGKPYEPDGRHPSKWAGSLALFEAYLEGDGQPVKFAQCWVFAGCLTTACRLLGIACRPVSCYNSAHDTDFDRAIDKFFEEDGTKSAEGNDDSIWVAMQELKPLVFLIAPRPCLLTGPPCEPLLGAPRCASMRLDAPRPCLLTGPPSEPLLDAPRCASMRLDAPRCASSLLAHGSIV